MIGKEVTNCHLPLCDRNQPRERGFPELTKRLLHPFRSAPITPEDSSKLNGCDLPLSARQQMREEIANWHHFILILECRFFLRGSDCFLIRLKQRHNFRNVLPTHRP